MADLPPEVLNIIHNELQHDKPQHPYLYRCLLVSKSFCAFFRACLYQDLVIKLDTNSSRRLSSLATTLDSNSVLSAQARSLSIEVSASMFENDANRSLWDTLAHSAVYHSRSYSKIAVKRLSALIHTFRTDPLKIVLQHLIDAGHLESLSIVGIGEPLTWAMLNQKTKEALHQLRSLPSVRRLSYTLVHGMEEGMIWGSRGCGNLDSLSLRSVSITGSRSRANSAPMHLLRQLSMISCDTISILSPPKVDSSLNSDSSHPPVSRYADMSRLERLHFRGRLLGRYADTHLRSLLHSAAPSLRVLHIEFVSMGVRDNVFSPPNYSTTPSLQLSTFQSLHTVKISACQDCGRATWRVAEDFALFISTTSFPTHIPHLILSFTILTPFTIHDRHPFSPEFGWPALNNTFRHCGLDIGKMTVEITVVFRSDPSAMDPAVLNRWEKGVQTLFPVLPSLSSIRHCEIVFIPQFK